MNLLIVFAVLSCCSYCGVRSTSPSSSFSFDSSSASVVFPSPFATIDAHWAHIDAAIPNHHHDEINTSAPTVSIADGVVEGYSFDGVDTFKGIPYAAPPLGSLRWAVCNWISWIEATINSFSSLPHDSGDRERGRFQRECVLNSACFWIERDGYFALLRCPASFLTETSALQAPQPPQKWNSVLKATKYGDCCLQESIAFPMRCDMAYYTIKWDAKQRPLQPQLYHSENCLFLNVFAPKNVSKPLPVMVWIHVRSLCYERNTCVSSFIQKKKKKKKGGSFRDGCSALYSGHNLVKNSVASGNCKPCPCIYATTLLSWPWRAISKR